jgi:hypothetical protein
MFRTAVCLMIACVAAGVAPASTILTSTSGAGFITSRWNSTGAGTINNSPGPWFDKQSGDGGNCNVGFYIQGPSSTGCNYQPGGIDRFSGTTYNGPRAGTNGLDFWSGGSATVPDLAFSFAPDSPVYTVTLMAEAAAAYASYQLGFFVIMNGQRVDYTLFQGDLPIGSSINFSPGNYQWGFWFSGNGNKFYTTSSYNTTDTTTQHFAVFRDSAGSQTGANWQKLWIGIEDSGGSAADDWNDMIVTVACGQCGTGLDPTGPWVATPEPGTAALVLLGGVLVLVSRLRR